MAVLKLLMLYADAQAHLGKRQVGIIQFDKGL